MKFGFFPARGANMLFPNVVDTELPELTSVKEGRNGQSQITSRSGKAVGARNGRNAGFTVLAMQKENPGLVGQRYLPVLRCAAAISK
jgi:hypothetical protein